MAASIGCIDRNLAAGQTPRHFWGHSVKIKKYAVLLWAFLLATAAVAGEEHRTHIKIAVDDDGSGQQSFMFDSDDAGFDLQSLAVGETRAVTDASGNVANVSRTEAGIEIEVAGETIVLPDPGLGDLGAEQEYAMHMHSDAHVVDIDTEVAIDGARQIRIVKTGNVDNVTVISGGAIDEATRQRIREALASAGEDNEVEFIDSTEIHSNGARKEVHIIRKEIDVTN